MSGLAVVETATGEGTVETAAWLSDDEVYRYLLSRTWDHGRQHLGFIMLNPSTADATINDQTIKRCMFYARREGYGGIIVANLYAYRTVDPSILKRAARHGVDIVGPSNDEAIDQCLSDSTDVVVAWGGTHRPFINWREKAVVQMLRGHEAKCLGQTANRAPNHPSRLGNDVALVPWVGAAS